MRIKFRPTILSLAQSINYAILPATLPPTAWNTRTLGAWGQLEYQVGRLWRPPSIADTVHFLQTPDGTPCMTVDLQGFAPTEPFDLLIRRNADISTRLVLDVDAMGHGNANLPDTATHISRTGTARLFRNASGLGIRNEDRSKSLSVTLYGPDDTQVRTLAPDEEMPFARGTAYCVCSVLDIPFLQIRLPENPLGFLACNKGEGGCGTASIAPPRWQGPVAHRPPAPIREVPPRRLAAPRPIAPREEDPLGHPAALPIVTITDAEGNEHRTLLGSDKPKAQIRLDRGRLRIEIAPREYALIEHGKPHALRIGDTPVTVHWEGIGTNQQRPVSGRAYRNLQFLHSGPPPATVVLHSDIPWWQPGSLYPGGTVGTAISLDRSTGKIVGFTTRRDDVILIDVTYDMRSCRVMIEEVAQALPTPVAHALRELRALGDARGIDLLIPRGWYVIQR